MSTITYSTFLLSTTLPHHNILYLKKKKTLYFRTNLKNSEKELYERWEQGTTHTKFHADPSSFTRRGDHLMKCISQNLWGRAEATVQHHKICSCVAVLYCLHCLLRHREAKTHRTKLTLTGIGQRSRAVMTDQASKLLLKRLYTSLGIFSLSNLLAPEKLHLCVFPNINFFFRN